VLELVPIKNKKQIKKTNNIKKYTKKYGKMIEVYQNLRGKREREKEKDG